MKPSPSFAQHFKSRRMMAGYLAIWELRCSTRKKPMKPSPSFAQRFGSGRTTLRY